MPRFVPVVDVEKPRCEQDGNDTNYSKHRRWDAPHAKNLTSSSGPFGTTRSLNENPSVIYRKANKMIKDNRGLWIKNDGSKHNERSYSDSRKERSKVRSDDSFTDEERRNAKLKDKKKRKAEERGRHKRSKRKHCRISDESSDPDKEKMKRKRKKEKKKKDRKRHSNCIDYHAEEEENRRTHGKKRKRKEEAKENTGEEKNQVSTNDKKNETDTHDYRRVEKKTLPHEETLDRKLCEEEVICAGKEEETKVNEIKKEENEKSKMTEEEIMLKMGFPIGFAGN